MLCGSLDCPDCDIILAVWFCCTRERVCRCQSQTTADSGDLRHHPLAIAFCKLKSNFQAVFPLQTGRQSNTEMLYAVRVLNCKIVAVHLHYFLAYAASTIVVYITK